MMFKGYPNWKMIKQIGILAVDAIYPTIQRLGGYKNGLDCYVHQYHQLVGSDAIDALLVQAASDTTVIGLRVNAHGARVGDLVRFTSGDSIRREIKIFKIKDVNFFYLAEPIQSGEVAIGDLFNLYRPTQPLVDSQGRVTTAAMASLSIVDFLDTPVLRPSTTTIPRSSSSAIAVVASLAANVYKIQTIEDVGNFMALYADAARTNLLCYLPLAGGEVEVSIATGSSIYLGAVDNADITTANTSLMVHFLG